MPTSYKNPDERASKISSALKGKSKSPEHRQKMMEFNQRPETRQRRSESRKGRTHSPETKAKIAEAARQRWDTMDPDKKDALIEKRSAARRGKRRPDEAKAKTAETMRERWANPAYRERLRVAHRAKAAAWNDEERAAFVAAGQRTAHTPEANAKVAEKQKALWAARSSEEKRRRTAKWRLTGAPLGAKAIRERVGPTAIERMMAEELTKRGIAYEAEKPIRWFVVDFFVSDYRGQTLVIECDGAYWHSAERDPLRPLKDRRRDGYLTACGYRVIHLGEWDIRASVGDALDKALATL